VNPQILSRAVLAVLVFFAVGRLLQASNLVALSVDTQIASGHVAETAAPKLTAVWEYAVAGIVAAMFATTNVAGFLADQGLALLRTAKACLLGTASEQDDADDDLVVKALEGHERRIKALEKRYRELATPPPARRRS
jgi:hypothetical protein